MYKFKAKSKKPVEIRDHVVARDCGEYGWRYLCGIGAGSQYTDYKDFAARTTKATAEKYASYGPKYRIEQI